MTAKDDLNQNFTANSENITLAYHQALDLAQFKGSFLAKTSHELRSPMNALISSLQLIQAGLCDNPEEEKEYVGIAHDAALKFIGLLDDVIRVSKLQAGSLTIQNTSVDLPLLLSEVYMMTYLQVANRNLKLIIPTIETDLSVQTDETQLRQSLVMLIDRAIGLLDEGTIELHLTETATHVQLRLTHPEPQSTASPPAPPSPKNIPTQFSPEFRLVLAQEILTYIDLTPCTKLDASTATRLIELTLPKSLPSP